MLSRRRDRKEVVALGPDIGHNHSVVKRRSWALLLGFLLPGSLAVFLAAGASSSPDFRSSGDSAVGFAASRVAPAAVVAREGTPVVPGLDISGIPIRSSDPQIRLADLPSRDATRRAALIETRVADKYRSYRESLS